MPTVDHIFVLMLENRSFDHFFGLSGRPSIPRPSDPAFRPGASDRASFDPPHEFADVQAQIAGGMGGFAPAAKLAFEPSQVPVISQLADEFVLFDNWYSSVPGPTWPNRFFVHAASSGGLATSPSQFQASGSVILPKSAFQFQNGSTFDRLKAKQTPWRVYHGDVHPQVLAVPGMVKEYLSGSDHFCPTYGSGPHFSDFATDVSQATYEPAYTFIEPDYAIQILSQFRNGDSDHPLGLVSSGEGLITYVYEALRNSPLWPKSALLITWDEHGGFYDHMSPPQATPPGDAPLNRPTNGSDPGFAFDRLGVRVPAILISPLAPKGKLGSELFPGSFFDHSSVIKSVFENFALGASLTARDGAAPSWLGALTKGAREGAGDGPLTLSTGRRVAATAASAKHSRKEVETSARVDVDGFLAGTALIALDLDREMAKKPGTVPMANMVPQPLPKYEAARMASVSDPQFRLQLLEYINQIAVRAEVVRLKAKLRKAK